MGIVKNIFPQKGHPYSLGILPKDHPYTFRKSEDMSTELRKTYT